MRVRAATVVASVALPWLATAAPLAAEDVTPAGLWRTIDDRTGRPRANIRIWIERGELLGRIERLHPKPGQAPDPVCTRCSGSRHGQRVIGMTVLWGHRLERGHWSGGRVLDPEMGKDYPGRIWLEAPETLKVRGYWGPFHRTQTWHRLTEDPTLDPPGPAGR